MQTHRPHSGSTTRVSLRVGAALIAAGLALLVAQETTADSFPAVLELSTLDGDIGFVLTGMALDGSGRSLSGAGDINGDGWADVIIGAPGASPNGNAQAGAAYVVFGGPGVGSSGSIDLATLDGSTGFVIEGAAPGDGTGTSVGGVGDFNGDDVPDVIVGAIGADPGGQTGAGAVYVIFGGAGLGAGGTVDVVFDGTDGIALNCTDDRSAAGTSSDLAGDFNDDGYADVVVGADGADAGGLFAAGQAYIVFGGPDVGGGDGGKDLLPLNGADGLAMDGENATDLLGGSVSAVGDVNSDGVDDVIIGAIWVDPNGLSNAGESYVLFGGTPPFDSQILPSELNGTNGFVLRGVDVDDVSGLSVSNGGDLNDDGHDDLVIGASQADVTGAFTSDGEVYVVFGGPGLGSGGSLELSTLDGGNGFVIPGVAAGDNTGATVAPAGDVNGDGLPDILIGAFKADPGGRDEAGKAYVVFGAAGLGSGGTFDLAALDGGNGFALHGIVAGDRLTRNTSFGSALGDFNGDGVDDLLLAAPNAGAGEEPGGETYVVFGRTLDADSDGVADTADNCTLAANVDQRDTDGDGIGNRCDGDHDNDCNTNFVDLGLFKKNFLMEGDTEFDYDGDGFANFIDLGILKGELFLSPPGPSGIPNVCALD